jgi:hypothetical protein
LNALVLYGLRAPAAERLDVVEPAPSKVDEPAVLPLRETLEGEGRPEDVAREPLSAFAVVFVNADTGVEREALEKGAAANVGKRVEIPVP